MSSRGARPGVTSAVLMILGLLAACGGEPRLRIADDFGSAALFLEPDVVHERTVTLENRGESDLVLHDVASTCVCLQATHWPRDPIPPGRTADLGLRLKVGAGAHAQAGLLISSNDPQESPKLLLLDVYGLTPLEIETDPRRLELGRLSPGREVRETARVRVVGTLPLEAARLEWAGPSDGGLVVEALGFAAGPKALGGSLSERRGEVMVRFRSDRFSENLEEEVQIRVRVGDEVRGVPLPVTASLPRPIQASPARRYLGTMARGERRTARFTIEHRGGRPFRLAAGEPEPGLEIVGFPRSDREATRHEVELAAVRERDGPFALGLDCVATEAGSGRQLDVELRLAGVVAEKGRPR